MPPAPASPRAAITREKLLRQAQALPAAPQILGGLCELLEDINAGLDEVADQIRLDPALAARVLRISNSVLFGGLHLSSIDEAVNRVGFAEITRLVGIATVVGLVDRNLASYDISADRMRESLLLHALSSEVLAEFAGLDSRSAYAGGLLRGVGMMILDRALRAENYAGGNFDPARNATYTEWERAVCGVTGFEVTTMVLDEWRFPHELVAALERYHDPRDDAMAHVLNLAGAIVARAGLALPGEAKYWSLTAEKLAGAGLDEDAFQTAAERAIATFNQQRAALY